MLLLMLGMDTMVMDADGEDITDTPTVDITDTTEARGLLMLNLLLLLKPILRLMPLLMPGMDTTDIPDTTDTVPTDTDMVLDTTDTITDITDTPTPGLTVITTLERDLLMPNPRPNPRLKPNPGITAVGVDTMAIPTGDITDTDMAVVTGGKL